MIICGLESKCAQKQTIKEVYSLVPSVPRNLDLLEYEISLSQPDHPEYILNPSKTALVVDSIIGGCQLSKVLMDGKSGINVMHTNTMHKMGFLLTGFLPSPTHFHGIVPEKKQPLS